MRHRCGYGGNSAARHVAPIVGGDNKRTPSEKACGSEGSTKKRSRPSTTEKLIELKDLEVIGVAWVWVHQPHLTIFPS